MNQISKLVFLLLCLPNSTSWAGWVATSSPESTEVAKAILKNGGNAIDAACAAFFVQSVTQSYFTGLGGGGFAMVDIKGKIHHYDFREVAPNSVSPALFSKIDNKDPDSSAKRNTGVWSIGVPGNIAVCTHLSEKFGKKKWKEILDPAIQLAKNGFNISKMYEEELAEQWARIRPFQETRLIFEGADKNGIKKGETLKQPLLAQTLERIANEGGDSFYRGKLAKEWSSEARKEGIPIDENDLKKFKVLEKNPVQFKIGKFSITTAAPSSSAIYMIGGVLRYLNHYHSTNQSQKAADLNRYISEIEAIRYFAELRDKNIADLKKMSENIDSFFGSKKESLAWKEIDHRIQKRMSLIASNIVIEKSEKEKTSSHTSNISIVDDEGNAIAITTSVGNVFGSGVTIPKFGFLMNSTLGDFSYDEKNINLPDAGMRPRSNISPTFIYEKDKNGKKLIAVLGAAGGPLIPQSVIQFFENYFIYEMNGKESNAFPRISVSGKGAVEIENKAGLKIFEGLKKAGYNVSQTDVIWAVFNGIARKTDHSKWEPVNESRYDGSAWSSDQ